MMGRPASPACLFYDFCLDDHVPNGHLLRQIDVFLDLESIRHELKSFYSLIRRSSIDPELMIRMLIVGYCTACSLKSKCCPNNVSRTVLRSIHEGARDMARKIAGTDAGQASRRDRKKVEMLFAHLKRILKLGRLIRVGSTVSNKSEFFIKISTKRPQGFPSVSTDMRL